MMACRIKIQYIIILLLTIVSICLFFDNKNIREDYNRNNKSYNDTIKNYTDRYNRIIAEKSALVINKNTLKGKNDSLKELIKGYKPEIVVRWKTEYRDTGSVVVKYDTIIPFDFSVPFTYKSKWMEMSGLSTNKGLIFNNRAVFNEQSLVFGERKTGWFKPNYISVKIANTNPYMRTVSMESYKIKTKESWLLDKRTWIGTGIGIIAGFIIFK